MIDNHKKINIAVNGIGRIGKAVVRALFESAYTDFNLVAINSRSPSEYLYHSLKYDSVHGYFPHIHTTQDPNKLRMSEHNILICNKSEPNLLPWKEHNIDYVLETTGKFKNTEGASLHLEAGAKKVILSSPANDQITKTIVLGVNENTIDPQDKVIAASSCTTNATAPLIKILQKLGGINSAFITTIHSYTNDQKLVDSSHKDYKRSRAAALSIIPSTTGVSKEITKLFPELDNKIQATSFRVPTPNVSLIDCSFNLNQDITKEQLIDLLKNEEQTNLIGILATNSSPLVSIDFNHTKYSLIVDLNELQIIDKRFVRIVCWYDNEWAFAHRMLDLIRIIEKKNS